MLAGLLGYLIKKHGGPFLESRSQKIREGLEAGKKRRPTAEAVAAAVQGENRQSGSRNCRPARLREGRSRTRSRSPSPRSRNRDAPHGAAHSRRNRLDRQARAPRIAPLRRNPRDGSGRTENSQSHDSGHRVHAPRNFAGDIEAHVASLEVRSMRNLELILLLAGKCESVWGRRFRCPVSSGARRLFFLFFRSPPNDLRHRRKPLRARPGRRSYSPEISVASGRSRGPATRVLRLHLHRAGIATRTRVPAVPRRANEP